MEELAYHVYVLRSLRDGKLYVGYTSDLHKRLQEHNAGKTESLKWRRPLVLIYSERYAQKIEAQQREKFLKTGKGREEIKRILTDLSAATPR